MSKYKEKKAVNTKVKDGLYKQQKYIKYWNTTVCVMNIKYADKWRSHL